MKVPALCVFIASLLITCATTYGQKKQEDKVYLEFFYVKPMPAMHHEYIKYEDEIFKPLHQAAVNAGNMISFSCFWVEASSEYVRDYDFVVVKAYKSIHDLDAYTPDSFYVNIHVGLNTDSLRRVGFKTRESPRREIWVVEKQHAKSILGQFNSAKLLMNFTNKPGSDSLMYTSLAKDSTISNWESYSLMLPQSSKYPYQYLSICLFDGYSSLPPLLEKTRAAALKNNVKQELWSRWVGTDSKALD